MAHREQEVALRLSCLLQLLGHLVERCREQCQLRGSFDGNGIRGDAFGQAAARLGHATHRPCDRTRREEGANGGECGGDGARDEQRHEERLPVGEAQGLRAEQHEATALDVARSEEIGLSVDRDRAPGGAPRADVGEMLPLEIRRRLLQVDDLDSLLLLLEERLQSLQPREREQDVGLVLPLRDEVCLVGEVVEVGPLDGSSRQRDPDGEGDADRDHDDDDDREEETSAERREPPRAHGAATALYPAPRTVLIRVGRPSLRRSWPTWTSTVRVPPG